MTRWLDSAEMLVWESFVISTMNLFSILDDELKRRFDITHLDYGLLTQMSATADGRRMSDLAAMFGVDPSVVTYRIGRMEKRDLVTRSVCPTDGRGILAKITGEGRRLLDQAAPMHVESVRALFFDHLDRDDFEVLARSFGRIREAQFRHAGTA